MLTDDAKEYVIGKGKNTDYGARPLRRSLEHWVEDPLAEELLRGEFAGKDLIEVDGIRDEEGKRVLRLQFNGKVRDKGEAVAASSSEDSDE